MECGRLFSNSLLSMVWAGFAGTRGVAAPSLFSSVVIVFVEDVCDDFFEIDFSKMFCCLPTIFSCACVANKN